MARCVAFLRAINTGRRRVAMERLRELFEEAGFAEVATFIASGNVIFSTAARDTAKLETRIEKVLREGLGYEVETYVRTLEEVQAIAAGDPFGGDAREDGGDDDGGEAWSLYVGFFKEPPAAATARAFEAVTTANDRFLVVGREWYWRRRGGVADADVWTTPAMRAVKLPVTTMRNTTSVRKLVARHGRAEGRAM
ncbi:DUF1697 domain-containing protein [Congregicoccus parvus]|uniref:DUF1697 domain-containing protein n=1 Tax=Congregicoccus parvus TaxID=3081749 RepID=UPI003FA56BB2